MQTKSTLSRTILLALIVAAPAGSLPAFAQQQEGQQKPAPAPQQEQKQPQYSISVEAPLVNVDAVVTDQDGNIVTGLKKENFRITEDGVPQTVTNFAPTDAPITIVILMEYSRLVYSYYFGASAASAQYWSYDFLNHLGPKDWVALVTFDLKPTIRADFTQNKMEVQDAITHLFYPDFHEATLFDSLLDTLSRLQDVKGKKAILLLATGFDTFSKHTLDQTYKQLKQTDVTIFCVGTAEQALVRANADIGVGYLQAKNELSTFARQTGGYAWFPRFDGELPSIFQSVTAFLRNQYTVGYSPTNQAHDGKYRKIKVEVVDDNGQPLVVADRKGKKKKIIVYARDGYLAPKGAVGD